MRRVWQSINRVPRTLILWGLLAAIAALSGPFGTYDTMPMQDRFAMWLVLIGIAIPMAALYRRCVDRWLEGTHSRLRSAVVALIFSLTFSPLLYMTTLALQARDLALVVPLWQVVLMTFLSALSVCTVRTYLGEYQAEPALGPPAAAEVVPAEGPSRLVARLPVEVRGALQAISVRDHYVDVHTENGMASLLLRLSDAIAEVGSVPGAQVHRSHWVAWAAVAGVESVKGGLVLLLVCGSRIPVSRANRSKLAAQGLI